MAGVRRIQRADDGSNDFVDRPPLGQILVRNNWLEDEALDRALRAQTLSGARLGQVITANGWSSRDQVGRALAQQWGLGYVDLDRDPVDPALLAEADAEACVTGRILPWRRLGPLTTYVTDRPETVAQALGRMGDPFGGAFVAVTTAEQMDRALSAGFGRALAERAATLLPEEQSVRRIGWERAMVGLLGIAAATALVTGGEIALIAGFALVLLLHLATLALRTAALVAGARAPTETRPADPATVRLADHRSRPVVSLLVPLYREQGMIGRIVDALARLDYPRELLDVKLLIEEEDRQTREAIAAASLPGWITVLVVPDGQPRTKPRALNHALSFCRGDVIGVLDAEDRPEPEQVARVVHHLANAPPETMAVQCQLGYYNAAENWLSRCFQLEYAIWFEVLLRGYRRLRLPLPLGGTSVYFRASALRALGGWDAHNVTEDADLGVRIARAGGHTAVLSSTTGEEAACGLIRWVRQRSRWTKGYILTWLAHMRTPVALWRDLGARGFLAFQVIFLGGALTYLAMPLFWLSLLGWLVADEGLWHHAVPEVMTRPVGLSLCFGWAVMLAAAAIAMARRRSLTLLVWAPTLPIYWWLGAFAAWKAVIEFLLAPYYWDKTRHGVSSVGLPEGEPTFAPLEEVPQTTWAVPAE